MVFIRDLQVSAIIGAHDWERLVKQVLVFDVELASDVAAAASDDRLEDALDYAAVAQRITTFMHAHEFHLVETAAHRLAELLMEEFRSPWIRLAVKKPRPLNGGHTVGVVVERGTRNTPLPAPPAP